MQELTNLVQIADMAIAQFAPTYEIQWVKGVADLPLCATYLEDFCTLTSFRFTRVPYPEDATCLFVLLHEIGHVVHNDPGTKFNQCNAEERASRWACYYMHERGVSVPQEMWEKAQEFWRVAARNCTARGGPAVPTEREKRQLAEVQALRRAGVPMSRILGR